MIRYFEYEEDVEKRTNRFVAVVVVAVVRRLSFVVRRSSLVLAVGVGCCLRWLWRWLKVAAAAVVVVVVVVVSGGRGGAGFAVVCSD